MLSLFGILVCATSLAHQGHHQGEHTNVAKTEEVAPDLKKTYEEINKDYFSEVKPIFKNKCAACHSSDKAAPGYASIPIVHWIVESDRSEAKEHMEISKGFPFQGHGTPMEDLDAIKEAVTKNSMPTWLYSLFHSGSKLNDDEKNKILKWIANSQAKLNSEPAEQNHDEHDEH